jgi:hypothetical protein
VDAHARVYYGTRDVQKTHVARLKFPAPATMETWVTGQDPSFIKLVRTRSGIVDLGRDSRRSWGMGSAAVMTSSSASDC